MTNDTAAKSPAAPTEPAPRSENIHVRITQLRDEVELTRKELRSLEGKLKNRDPALKAGLQGENGVLQQRVSALETALYAMISGSMRPRDANEAAAIVETLRISTVDHCKKTNIDTSLWKKIES